MREERDAAEEGTTLVFVKDINLLGHFGRRRRHLDSAAATPSIMRTQCWS